MPTFVGRKHSVSVFRWRVMPRRGRSGDPRGRPRRRGRGQSSEISPNASATAAASEPVIARLSVATDASNRSHRSGPATPPGAGSKLVRRLGALAPGTGRQINPAACACSQATCSLAAASASEARRAENPGSGGRELVRTHRLSPVVAGVADRAQDVGALAVEVVVGLWAARSCGPAATPSGLGDPDGGSAQTSSAWRPGSAASVHADAIALFENPLEVGPFDSHSSSDPQRRQRPLVDPVADGLLIELEHSATSATVRYVSSRSLLSTDFRF